MKTKRLPALLLTLLLAFSCVTPALAARNDVTPTGTRDDSEYMLNQFEINLPELPSTSNTVADVLGTKSATAILSSVTYNNGKTGLTFAESYWRLNIAYQGNILRDSDTFKAGQTYRFAFATYLPEGLDIDNSLISEPKPNDYRLDLPVYINGIPGENIVIFYHPKVQQLDVNAWYTVPNTPVTPAASEKFIDTFDLRGLKLPEAGMTVGESLADVSVKDMSVFNAIWRTGDGLFREMDPAERFEAGKQYALVVSVKNDGITYKSDSEKNAIMTPLMNGKAMDGAMVTGGIQMNGCPTLNWRYNVPQEGTTHADAVKTVYINGLVLPSDGGKVSDSYANATVYFDKPDNTKKILEVEWKEVTADGRTNMMKDTDRFEQGKKYFLYMAIERGSDIFNESYDTGAIRTWYNADVYVNGEKAYGGTGNETANLCPGNGVSFYNYYTCTGSAPSVPTYNSYVDVSTTSWYFTYVNSATQMGLINGMSSTKYEPEGTLTLAQAVKLAACMNQLYTTGKVTLTNGSSEWYESYAAYARDNGILAGSKPTAFEIGYSNVMDEPNKVITRQEYAWIFARALPKEALPEVNRIPDNAIPDVPQTMSAWYDSIYTLYRAGIVNGNDAKGTFNPLSDIKRSEVAAIVVRMMDKSFRVAAPAELAK